MIRPPKILFLVHRVPYPPNRGDRIRSFHLLDHLARDADVYLATLADEPLEDGAAEALQARCRQVTIEQVPSFRWFRAFASLCFGQSATKGLFYSRLLRRTLEKWVGEVQFDAVVVFCSSMVQYLDIAGLENVPTLVDLVDVDSQKFFDYATATSGPRTWLYRIEGRRLRRLECSLPGRVNAITLVSDAEANLYRGFCPNQHTFALPNGVDLDYFQPRPASDHCHRCVFVGALDYRPNVDGISWFCREIWPRIQELRPGTTLAVVGRNPGPVVCKLGAIQGVEIVGSVPDVRPYIAQATTAVVPLRIARGIQNKVLEAMAMAKPVIASPSALEGLAVTPGENVIEAQSPQEWIDAIVRLWSDPDECHRLSTAARRFVEQEHGWPKCLAALDGLLGIWPRARATQELIAP